MTLVVATFWAIALAACAGLRLFMPFLFLSVMTRYMHTPVPDMLAWVASDQGFVILIIATVVESVGDKIPIVDHALDTVATFVKPVAGLILPVALMSHIEPSAAWILGIAAGAPLALGVHATKAGTRAASTATTMGAGNPILSAFEDALAVFMLVLTALLPVLAFIAALVLLYFVVKALRKIPKLRNMRTKTLALLICSLGIVGGCGDDSPTSSVTSLQIIDTQVGTGAEATVGKNVTVHYTGWLYEEYTADHHGTKFDSSRDRNAPFSFVIGTTNIIQGWNQGIVGMKVGGKRTLIIPPELAYGSSGFGSIPPNRALVFDIELLSVQ
jgi:FKBP-type peptidyl-prolyl cis-trans isomerase FkpA